ncbi:putative ABC transporter permease protein [Paramagnetospirillum magnetotacticum MS-1]|uniref:Putative ABC transporter permease protein n=1 Tax=Paramagnetospirillum magnetotacticum MS-1 TaxID=272627 RepID=A0A0C2YE79_PARME|nr:FtsX-like permease family protein [Paramagnetospirillum magnetotacticum]KIL98009.1 putative ABC transporter permease protein [Paramagnetospirillum magnetotacticum MS-1]
MIRLALTFARRELRGGLKGFRVLVACLALGVAAIAGAGSLRAAFDAALAEDSRAMLGGDLDIRQTHQPFAPDMLEVLSGLGKVTQGLEMRAMIQVDGNTRRSLVELKGVDETYPLVGRLELAPSPPLRGSLPPPAELEEGRGEGIFAFHDGAWGAAAEANLLDRLGLKLGDRVAVGDAVFRITAVIVKEPDRIATALSFGPRLMVDKRAVEATGLIRPGSLVRYTLRLLLPDPSGTPAAKAELARRFPEAPWQMRDAAEAAPGVGRFLDILASFLALVGLTALLVGGIGVANAVKAYLDGRIGTIATLKCLGAPSNLIFATYFLLVGLLAAIGILLGLAAGAGLVPLVAELGAERIPLALKVGLYPRPLMIAAGFGALSALVFTLWPLARAKAIPAAVLFRRLVAPEPGRIGKPVLAALVLAAGGLAGLAVVSAANRPLAAWFVGAAAATLVLFRALAWALSKAAAVLAARHGKKAGPTWRMALANLHRPGSAVVGMVLSLGLGLSVLVTIALVEGNLAAQFGERLPEQAPSFYFIDIQPDQIDMLERVVSQTDPASILSKAALVRGRISSIGGVPVGQASIAPETQWAARGDRGLSMAASPPPGARIVAGQWWPEDYRGAPLASVDAAVAKGFGLKVGDRLGLNVLGREIEVEVANLRQIDWSNLTMNFAFLLSPGTLEGAPHTYIASLRTAPDMDSMVEKAVTDHLPNVSSIRVKEVLDAAKSIIAEADLAVRLAGLVTLAAGALVLAGAVMAGHRRRVWEAVVLKVLGATRGQLWRAHLAEFALIGLVTGLAAALVGSMAARAILLYVMKTDWVFLPGATAATLAACVTASLLAGFIGTWKALGAKAAPLLRNE